MGIRNKVTGEFYSIATYDPSTGNVTGVNLVGGTTDLGNVSNVYIGGGNPGEVLSTDGTGILSWIPGGGGGSTGNVTFADVTVQGVYQLNLSAGPDYTANFAYLQLRAGDYPSHIHLDTGNNDAYDLFIGTDSKYVQVSSTGNILMSSYDGANSHQMNLDTTGNLTIPGNIQTVTTGFAFSSDISGIDTGNVTVVVTIVDTDFVDPDSGQVTITDVVGTIEANGTWYFQALTPNTMQLYYDKELTSPVDGTTWTAYVSGGLAVSPGYSNISVTGGNVAIITNVGDTWTFGADGLLTLPGGIIVDSSDDNFEVRAANNINFEASSNVNISTGGGAGQWKFDTDGVLTIPGATYAPTSLNTIKGGYGFTLHPTHNTGGTGPELYISYNDGIEITPITNDYYAGGTRAAPLYIVGASTTETGKLPGTVNIQGGQNTTDNTYANVRISTGFNRWTFDTNGTLTLPPTSTAAIEGTDGENVRIRANSTSDAASVSLQNYDGSSTTTSISAKTDLVDIIAESNRWIFDNTGNLTIPGTSGGFIKTVANASIGIAAMDDGTDNPAQMMSWNVGSSNPTTIISAYASNARIQTDVLGALNTWTFEANGVTVFPGDLISTGASPAPSINGFSSASFFGNVTANYFIGNGSQLTDIAGSSITGIVASASVATAANSVAGANVSGQVANALVAGTVYTAAQPNITSVGTLTTLDVSGNVLLGNANIGNLVVTGTTTTANVSDLDVANATIVISSGANALVSNGAGLFVGSEVATVGSLTYLYSSNSWNSSLLFQAPDFTTSGNVTGGSIIGEGGNLSNITAANITGTVASATVASSANSVAGANVSGQVGNALVAGTVYTAAQPNITSVGTLTDLDVTGNITAGFIIGDGSQLTNLPVPAPSIGTMTSGANIAPAATNVQYNVTALAVASNVDAPTGTPTDGSKLTIRIIDDGTSQALTWDAVYQTIGTTLPTTTVANKFIYVGAIYNAQVSKWDVVSVATQA